MSRSLADETTKDIWDGVNSEAPRRIPRTWEFLPHVDEPGTMEIRARNNAVQKIRVHAR